jgi:hypothetical protein
VRISALWDLDIELAYFYDVRTTGAGLLSYICEESAAIFRRLVSHLITKPHPDCAVFAWRAKPAAQLNILCKDL